MENIGWAGLSVIPTFRNFSRELDKGTSGPLTSAGEHGGERFGTGFAHKAGHRIHETFRDTAKYIIGPLVGAFAVEKVGEVIGESIRSASDLAAAQGRSNLIFGKSSDEVDKFSEHAAKGFGLSALQAESAATQFGLVLKGAKASREESSKYSVVLTKLSADLASFAHTDPSQAANALAKGLQGSTRGLKQYGIIIDQTAIKASALKLGILQPVKDQTKIHAAQVNVLKDTQAYTDAVQKSGKSSLAAQEAQARLGTANDTLEKALAGTVPPLTAQQKVLATLPLILQQTKTQQGQTARSTNDLAVQQRKLSAEWSNAKDRLGKGLMPIVTDFVKYLIRDAVPKINQFSRWFGDKGAPDVQKLADNLKPLAHELLPAAARAFGDIRDFAKGALPYAKKVVGAFNDMPDWVQKVLVGGAVGGVAAKKLGLFSLLGSRKGGGSGITGLLTSARPIPVIVTNPGFGGAVGAATEAEGAAAGTVVARQSLLLHARNVTIQGAVLSVAAAEAINAGVKQAGMLKHNLPAIGGGSFGIPGLPTSGNPVNHSNAAQLNRELAAQKSLSDKWDINSRKAADYFQKLEQHKTTHLNLITNLDQVDRNARKVLATLLQIRDLHVSATFDTPAPGQVPNHTPSRAGKDGGGSHSRSVNVFQGAHVTINATDPRDAARRAIERGRAMATGALG